MKNAALGVLLLPLSLVLSAAASVDGGDQAPAQPSANVPVAADPGLPALLVGGRAPEIRVEKWLKGEPVAALDKGRIHVVEFWATWCTPCIESMPHLSSLQEKFGERARFIGVSIREGGPKDDTYDEAVGTRVAEFVKKNDGNMRYMVGFDGAAKFMRKAWMDAAGESGIPTAFVVDGAGRVAYIGHPASPAMEKTIDELVAGSFDLEGAAKKYRTRLTEKLELSRALALFEAGKPDEAVAALDALAAKSPGWARPVAVEKFRNLIDAKRIAQAMALVPEMLDKHLADDGQLLCAVAETIVELPEAERRPGLPLALRAAQRAVEINTNNYPVPPSVLAGVYWAMGDRAEAIRWQRKAIELAPEEAKEYFAPKLAEYEAGK